MPQNDMTTVANVRQWLGSPDRSTNDDQLLISKLITRASDIVRGYLNRPSFISRTYVETRDGTGTRFMMMRNWPVTSIGAVSVNGTAIAVSNSPPNGAGFWFDPWDGFSPGGPQALYMAGYAFSQGRANTILTYAAGYLEQNDVQTIDNTVYQLTPSGANGLMVVDAGVSFVGGAALVAVAANPTTGQYVAPTPLAVPAQAVLFYQFAAADAGKAVKLSYSYIPHAIESVVCNMVGERMRYRSRIGETTKSMGGQETASFSLKDITDYDKMSMQSYRSVVPI